MKQLSTNRRSIWRRLRALVVGLVTSALFVAQPAEAGVFHPTGSMSNARRSHTATLLANGKALVAGGYPTSGYSTNILSSAEVFDPATGMWTVTGAMSHGRVAHTATLLPSGKVLVAGGYFADTLSSAEVFDPTTGTWTPTGAMHTSRDGHTATLLPNGKVLVAGGDGTNYDPVVSAELYDPATGTWTETGALNEAHSLHTATLLGDGKVLVTAGYGLSGYAFRTELYDPATGTWSPTVDSFYALDGHTASLLPNGQVLAAGGFEYGTFGNYVGKSFALVFDPASATWTYTGDLNIGRGAHTASLLFNGRVLVTGGRKNTLFYVQEIASAEEYDPTTGLWQLAGAMAIPRYSHTATLLSDGQVLLAGGVAWNGTNDVAVASAELYDYPHVPDPQPPTLTSTTILPNGSFQFSFTNTPGATFSMLATTFPTLPSSEWMVLDGVTEVLPGQFQFTDPQATNYAKRFYRTRSP